MSVILDFSTHRRSDATTHPTLIQPEQGEPGILLPMLVDCSSPQCGCNYRKGVIGSPIVFRMPFFKTDWATADEVASVLTRMLAHLPTDQRVPSVGVQDISTPKRHPVLWRLWVQTTGHSARVDLPVCPLVGLTRLMPDGQTGIGYFSWPMPAPIRGAMLPSTLPVEKRYQGAVEALRGAGYFVTEPADDYSDGWRPTTGQQAQEVG